MTLDSTKYHFDALSMTDYSMLVTEDSTHPMHVAAVTIFEGDKLSRPMAASISIPCASPLPQPCPSYLATDKS